MSDFVTFLTGFEIEDDDVIICRYFKLEYFCDLINNKNLYFSSALAFADEFEGSISDQDFKISYYKNQSIPPPNELEIIKKYHSYTPLGKAFKELTRLTKISCWHMRSHESSLMWGKYAENGKGVLITSTIRKLKSALGEYKITSAYQPENIYMGVVKYINYSEQQMEDSSCLGRFFYKRHYFKDENEFRIAISLRLASEFGVKVPDSGIQVPIIPSLLIDNVICQDTATLEEVKKICKDIPEIIIKVSSIKGHPVY